MNPTPQFYYDTTPRDVPNLCVIECGASPKRPACRRVLQRRTDDHGGVALWQRVTAEVNELAAEHGEHGARGELRFYDGTLATFERDYGGTASTTIGSPCTGSWRPTSAAKCAYGPRPSSRS
jgi:hypothetical protein